MSAFRLFDRGLENILLSRPDAAVRDLHRALQIDGGHRLARFWYAKALRAAGRVRAAVLQARELERMLEREPAGATVEDGTPVRELLAATRTLVDELS